MTSYYVSITEQTTAKSYLFVKQQIVRKNRIGGCPLMSENELKKAGRGSFDYRTDTTTGLHLIRWLDNSCVQVLSTYSGVKASSTIKRWDGKAKKHVDVPCPDVVRQYNESLGGVDLSHMLISLHRTKINQKMVPEGHLSLHWYR